MTRDEIIKMALEASKYGEGGWLHEMAQRSHIVLARFAALVAAAEREECAKVAKAISDKYAFGYYGNEVDTADEIESAIRARGAA